MPERWIVDAMNVIGSRPDGWWKDRDAAMRDFARIVDGHARLTGKDITVVFDSDPRRLPETPNVTIVIARRRGADAADQEIEQLVVDEDDPGHLWVVSSDRALIDKVTALGAKAVSAGAFRNELES
jgi:predicted RNA-binding protein with PIN domain